MAMKMDLNAVIEQIETGEQDSALKALQRYTTQMNQCFTFSEGDNDGEEEKLQKYLGQLVMSLLSRDLQPSCQLCCLQTVRILTRNRRVLDPFISRSSMSTLARHAAIAVTYSASPDLHLQEGEEPGERAESQEAPPPPENPDQEVIVEALKSLCNILLHNEAGQVIAAELQLIEGVAERLKQSHDPTWNDEVRFFDLRLTFLLTALRVDVRTQLSQELHGVRLLGNQLDSILVLVWSDSLEAARPGLGGLSRQQTEQAMEVLKILFNLTFDTNKRKVDEEEAAEYRHLVAILRQCLLSQADGDERTEEFHSHCINLLGNLPLPCLDVLLTPKVQPGSMEYMGVNMDAVSILLDFMETRIDRGHKLKETLLPCLNLLTESSRIHRETRKFLRSKVLPPLRDVVNKPEVGETLRNKIVRLMTHVDTDVKDCAAELLFVLCKENVSRFIKYTGYGNAAGLLAARGLLRGARESGIYSDEEDSETEEYKEAKSMINPITGVVEEQQPNPMEGMTEEQKEYETMKLLQMFDKLSRNNLIQPMQMGMDGKMREFNPNDPNTTTHNPLFQPEEPDSDEEDEDP